MEIINNECYVSLEVAKLLKKVGFDWNCRKIYYCYHEDNDTWELEDNYKNHQYILELDYCLLVPTLEVAQRWLRETQGIEVYIIPFRTNYKFIICYIGEIESDVKYTTYEKAQEAGIKKALKIILEKGE